MSNKVLSPDTKSQVEQNTVEPGRIKNRHWRLQKALDILLNYLMELERTNQAVKESKVPEDAGRLLR
jgi:hypothetical protein